jgi:hypothetical protein
MITLLFKYAYIRTFINIFRGRNSVASRATLSVLEGMKIQHR